MRNILRYLGGNYPEETLFGLGEGLSFIYVDHQPVPPYVAIHGRSLDLEEVLGKRLGYTVEVIRSSNPEEAMKAAVELLEKGLPVLINTDIKYLDYFKSSTHFAGHRVVLVGTNEDGKYLISDSEFPTIQEISAESLMKARQSDIPPFGEPNLAVVFTGRGRKPEPNDFIDALVSCGIRMLFPENPLFGVTGMLRASREMGRWNEMSETPEFAARFAYQVIEKRGTGGGFFRRMYSRFLLHGAHATGREEFRRLADEMTRIADAWTDLALSLKEASEDFSPSKMAQCGEKLADIAVMEGKFFEKALLAFT